MLIVLLKSSMRYYIIIIIIIINNNNDYCQIKGNVKGVVGRYPTNSSEEYEIFAKVNNCCLLLLFID